MTTGEDIADINDEEDEDTSGLKSFEKAKTQFDGITSENQVTYLKLQTNQGVELPVLSTGITDEYIDFTVMLWFKIDDDESEISGSEIMYLFQFPDSVACYITG